MRTLTSYNRFVHILVEYSVKMCSLYFSKTEVVLVKVSSKSIQHICFKCFSQFSQIFRLFSWLKCETYFYRASYIVNFLFFRYTAESATKQRVEYANNHRLGIVCSSRRASGSPPVLSPATRELSGSPSKQHSSHAYFASFIAPSSSSDGGQRGASVERHAACYIWSLSVARA